MAQNNFEFIVTKRLSEALVVDNYIYRIDKLVNTKRYWKCKTPGCRATALTDGNALIRAASLEMHGHGDDAMELDGRKFKEDVKRTVGKTIVVVHKICCMKHSNFRKHFPIVTNRPH
jgi:hypothetical protein